MNRTVVCDNHDQIRINLIGHGVAIVAPAKLIVELLEAADDSQQSSLTNENQQLRQALSKTRILAQSNGWTMREFAKAIGVTATQLSQWTDSTPNREPDFKD